MPAEAKKQVTSTRTRLLILSGVFSVILLVLLVQLWSMQVINGKTYLAQSNANRISEVTSIAPRGTISDRNGKILVDNRETTAIVADRSIKSDKGTLKRLSSLLGIPQSAILMRMENSHEAALAPKVIEFDPSKEAVAYIAEHQDLFKGVTVEDRTVRVYPNGNVAAHILGYTGGISDAELKNQTAIKYSAGDIVGKSGVESQFESVLQGDRGERRVEVDAGGRIVKQLEELQAPRAGSDIKLTIDLKIQKAAQKALKNSFVAAKKLKFPKAKSGAIVVTEVKTGDILAMDSAPTYNPEEFIGGIDEDQWKKLNSKEAGTPLNNRAISSGYPPASTFKAFVGMAALQNNVASANTSYLCEGTWLGMGKQWPKRCWLRSGHRHIGFTDAIAQSCDVAFYEMGNSFYKKARNTDKQPLQDYLKTWGYGAKTGIELPGEVAGVVPDPNWKENRFKNYPEERAWVPGDMANLSIGQGYMLATPLQLATSYAGIANGGTLLKPQILKSVLDENGQEALKQEPQPYENQPKISKENLGVIQGGLRRVVTDGTAKKTFAGFKINVAGKSGTAEVGKKDDYALFVAYAPYDNPKYCVTTVIEEGGGGSSVAAAACREVLAALFKIDDAKVQLGEDRSR